jgi:hypothetical protein
MFGSSAIVQEVRWIRFCYNISSYRLVVATKRYPKTVDVGTSVHSKIRLDYELGTF